MLQAIHDDFGLTIEQPADTPGIEFGNINFTSLHHQPHRAAQPFCNNLFTPVFAGSQASHRSGGVVGDQQTAVGVEHRAVGCSEFRSLNDLVVIS